MIRRLSINQVGMTLVELIVAMVVISIAMGGVMMVMNYTTSHSADPVLRHQAIAIAESYMEEISLKSFIDPGGPAETGRADYDNVADYHSLNDAGAHDQTGAGISGLENYNVSVSVTAVNYGPAGAEVAGLQIEVTVTDPAGEVFTLTGYRAPY